jgi:hypothetical protein
VGILLHVALALTGLWGVAHLFATRGVVAGFGELTAGNRRIITMEWIVEGVALISTAAFVCPIIFTLSAVLIALGAWL